jgi:hypothetical protein
MAAGGWTMRTPLPMPATVVVLIENSDDDGGPVWVYSRRLVLLCCCLLLGWCVVVFWEEGEANRILFLSNKYVCIHASGQKVRMYPCISVASYVCRQYQKPASSLQVPCKFPASAASAYPIKICNTSATPKNQQCGCTWYKIHQFLRGSLQRICNAKKSAMRMHCRCSELAANLQGTCRELAGNLQGTCRQVPIQYMGTCRNGTRNKLQSQTKKRENDHGPPAPDRRRRRGGSSRPRQAAYPTTMTA